MDKNAPVVEFRGLSKSFGPVQAVEGVSFRVETGRVVGLLGRNGAGKTTLLRSLLGLIKPTEGEALLWGKHYSETTDAPHRVGAMVDGMVAVPGATGRREISLWAAALGLPKSRVEEVLNLVELAGDADRPVSAYSTGMRQRLGLGVALLASPQLLVLDEPANGLDPEGVRWLRRLVRKYAEDGRSVLLCSHQLAEVEKTVDDVVILQQTVLYSGSIGEFTQGKDLEERFFEVVGERAMDASF